MQRLTREATIGVRGESYQTVHAFVVHDRDYTDLPDNYEAELQAWAHDEFATALDPGEEHSRVGTMEYVPNDEVVEFRLR